MLPAPFSNVETLLDTYYIAGFVPLFARSGLSLLLLVSLEGANEGCKVG